MRPGHGLRLLVVHNRYRSTLPSGENNVVDREIEMLRDAGVKVSTWIRESDDIATMSFDQRLALPTRPIWSHRDTKAIAEIIERDHPQILHLHNPYPLISPGIIRTAKRRGVAVVHSVHNYRHSCLNGLHLRDGQVCTTCTGRRVAVAGVGHGCYRDSRLQSLVLATAEAAHRSTWSQVDRFFALGEFMAEQLVAAGIDGSKVVVKPNFVDDPGPPTPLGKGFLFAGRLDEAKGIRLLLDAWQRSGLDGSVDLVVVGDGPLRDEVERRASMAASVEVTGRLDPAQLSERLRGCAVVVVPSVWYEGPPTIGLEALAHGRPVLVTDVGALPELVHQGAGRLAPADPAGLAAALVGLAGPSFDPYVIRSVYDARFRRESVRDLMLGHYWELAGCRGLATRC